MENTKQLIFKIIDNQIFHKKHVINLDNVFLEMFIKVVKSHHLEMIVYEELKKQNLEIPLELETTYNKSLHKFLMQEHHYQILIEKLKEENIKYLPLKGIIIKDIYPKAYLRTMSDIDLLIEKTNQKRVKEIMLNLNYQIKSYNLAHHDLYTNEFGVLIEIHHSLLTSDHKYSLYYKDKNLFNNNFSINDYYIYNIIHLVKHFINGGIGIRNLIDLKQYNIYYKNGLDYDYITSELKNLDLEVFHEKMKDLYEVWFENKEATPPLKKLEEYVLRSGTYGLIKNRAIIKMINNNDKYLFRRLFPKFKEMKGTYHKLNKCPFLLPYYYLVRFLRAVKRKSIKNEYEQIDNISIEELYNLKEVLKDVNLIK